MNLFITQIPKREMEGKADVLFSDGDEARRSSVQCGALDYTDGQPSSQRVLHFGNEGPLVPEERRALHSFFSVGPWRPHEKCLFGFSLLETK